MKNIRFFLVAIVAVLLVACGGGTLYNVPSLHNYDFKYLSDFSLPYYNLFDNTQRRVLYTKFEWSGERGEVIDDPQHALVAYTQRISPNMENAYGEVLWTHGAGAFVGEQGLEMELWFRRDKDGNGYEDDDSDAYVWSQNYGRCVRDVAGTITEDIRCLDDKPNKDGFLTPAPNFQLRKGVPYVLRIELRTEGNDTTVLEAALFSVTSMGLEVVQQGLVKFPTKDHFPIEGQTLEASVARTPGVPGESVIDYTMFR